MSIPPSPAPKAASFTVRAVHCDHTACDEEIYEAVCAVTDPLWRAWRRLERAQTIAIKVNMAMPPDRIVRLGGRRQELVDEAVLRATLRRLRERTSAHIIATDTEIWGFNAGSPQNELNYLDILREFDVDFVHANHAPTAIYSVPGGGCMFSSYQLPACVGEADAFVSIAKLKTHLFQGFSLTLKNLFGLPPLPPRGRARAYFHHIIRLPYVLADLGRIVQPCLNIVDGLVGQSGREWRGEGRISNVLIAGDHAIATDTCGSWLMGHDPTADWPQAPFLRDRNPLLVAAESGFGTVRLDDIDFECTAQRLVGQFEPIMVDPMETMISWRRTACEQALFYRDHLTDFVAAYAGQFIMLQDYKVVWRTSELSALPSRRALAGGQKELALWLKYVDPQEQEGENFAVYERELAKILAIGAADTTLNACGGTPGEHRQD